VRDRVRREFGDEHRRRIGGTAAVREPPGVETVQREVAGETGTERRAAETLGERPHVSGGVGAGG
jgi:hypothetical protein